MQGKKLLAFFLPLLLMGVFLFLLAREGFFSDAAAWQENKESAKTQQASTAEETFAKIADTTVNVTLAELPLLTVGTAPMTTEETMATMTLGVSEREDSLAVMAPASDKTSGLITEFSDAFLVTTPEDTEAKPSVLVTGFADTLPLVLPVASPAEVGESEMRAVYVASVYNLDLPSSPSLSEKELRQELDDLVKGAVSSACNTLFFQVRPASDALYESAIFPSSRFWVAREGETSTFDPLAYLVTSAHADGIKVHAWVNPFRVTLAGESLSSLDENNPARKDPSLTFTVNRQVYYDPAQNRVHKLIADGVAELVARYDVDGILFDDYFYPTDVGLADSDSYEAYRQGGGVLSLADWRRDNVNRLVERVYRTVKALRPECLFGISPRGIWRNSREDPKGSDTLGGAAYDEIYCDALAWVEGGYIDYLSPQIYWSFDSAAAPFGVLADWWDRALQDSGVTLTVSLAAYYLPKEEIEAQKEYLKALSSYGGYALYRYRSVCS